MSTVTAPGQPMSIASCLEMPAIFTIALSATQTPAVWFFAMRIGSQFARTKAVELFQACRPMPKPAIVPEVKLSRDADAASTPIEVADEPPPVSVAALIVHSLWPMQLKDGSYVPVPSDHVPWVSELKLACEPRINWMVPFTVVPLKVVLRVLINSSVPLLSFSDRKRIEFAAVIDTDPVIVRPETVRRSARLVSMS